MSQLILVVIFFTVGLFIGSFLNVLIDRIARNEKFFSGRSYCEACRHPLSWRDLIPLFSFIFLRGKCRYCQEKIPVWLPVVELTTGLAFAFTYYISQDSFPLLVFLRLVLACFVIILFFADLKYRLVYDIVIYPAILTGLVYQLVFFNWSLPINYLVTPFLTAAFFFFLYLITKKRGMGLGDVQIGFFMGLLLGWPKIIVALYFAFLTGALVGIILMITKKAKMKSAVPFGPFLLTGTVVALIWGEKIYQSARLILIQ